LIENKKEKISVQEETKSRDSSDKTIEGTKSLADMVPSFRTPTKKEE
jgi:hypothetical protein